MAGSSLRWAAQVLRGQLPDRLFAHAEALPELRAHANGDRSRVPPRTSLRAACRRRSVLSYPAVPESARAAVSRSGPARRLTTKKATAPCRSGDIGERSPRPRFSRTDDPDWDLRTAHAP